MPVHYGRFEYLAEGEALANVSDSNAALERLRRVGDELTAVWAELDAVAPQYASRRRNPVEEIDAFGDLLARKPALSQLS